MGKFTFNNAAVFYSKNSIYKLLALMGLFLEIETESTMPQYFKNKNKTHLSIAINTFQ